jgi:hypothetical protein
MLRCVAVALALFVLSTSAMAQVMYEPIRYQYETPRGEKYYYGGVDPRVHAVASNYYYSGCGFHGYATNLHRFDGGNSFGQPSPYYDRTPIYTDCIPYQNASWFGYTQADARNEAYANSPTYFRKADLLASAVPTATGGWVVPANAPNYVPVVHVDANRYPTTMMRSTTSPARPGQVIIIPKRLMDKKIKDIEGEKPQKVASAK